MKKIGLLGGLSPESTVEYYKTINSEIRKVFGGCASAELIIESFNFKEIEKLQFEDRWDLLAQKMTKAAQNLENCGAQEIAICTNLMHKVADEIQNNINIPIIHIVDAVAEEIQKQKIKTVGLLGTIFTMEEGFYKDRLENKYGIQTIIPNEKNRETISRIIYKELCCGVISDESRLEYLNIIEGLKYKGAEGIILGCTEIPLLVKEASLPLFDTTKIHALKIVETILKSELVLA